MLDYGIIFGKWLLFNFCFFCFLKELRVNVLLLVKFYIFIGFVILEYLIRL